MNLLTRLLSATGRSTAVAGLSGGLKHFGRGVQRQSGFSVVTGISDGILTALTLAAGKLLGHEPGMDVALAWRVAVATGASGAFVFFVAHYTALRSELIEAERQLNLTEHGRLATTALGRAVLLEANGRALISSVCSFSGALLPLMLGVADPKLAVAVSLGALGVLGAVLAKSVHGRPLLWAAILLGGGAVFAWLGTWLRIL
jgi:VIT1/CCC1 family predicted Fe2+/Mn2+ transporter